MLNLELIRIDGGTQSRARLDNDTITEYAEAFKDGALFPPVTVFYDGKDRWLADGFHRYHAAKQAGRTEIHETIIPGSLRDALIHSWKSNQQHGQRRTNEDKRCIVMAILEDQEGSKWTDNHIAKEFGFSHPFVGNIRRSLITVISDNPEMSLETLQVRNKDNQPTERTYINKHGQESVMDVSRIGKKAEAPIPSPEAPLSELDTLRAELETAHEALAELSSNLEETLADNKSMAKVFDANDQLTAALAEAKQYRELNRILNERINGLMNEKNEYIRLSNSWKRKYEKLEKERAQA